MEKRKTTTQDGLRPEYDLRSLRVRKFGPARKQFGNFVKLEPDVARAFLDAASVNEALRWLTQDSKESKKTPACHLLVQVDPISKQLDNSIVKLASDVAAVFSDAAAVNKALRQLIRVTKKNSAGLPKK